MKVPFTLPKSSVFRDIQIPARVALPFAPGLVKDCNGAVVSESGEAWPTQVEILSRWPDGSARWALATFLAKIDGNCPKQLLFDSDASAPHPVNGVGVELQGDTVGISTGTLEIILDTSTTTVRACAVETEQVRFSNNSTLAELTDFQGHAYRVEGGACRCVIEREGPVWGCVRLEGKHRDAAGKEFLDYSLRLHVWAGQPIIGFEYRIVNRDVRPHAVLHKIISRWCVEVAGDSQERHFVRQTQSWRPPEVVDETETRVEAFSPGHFETNEYSSAYPAWIDYRAQRVGLSIGCRHFNQNYPKRLAAERNGVRAEILPNCSQPLTLWYGMAKTHELLCVFHDGRLSLEELAARHFYFNLPLQGVLAAEYVAASGAFPCGYLAPQRRNHRLETIVFQIMDNLPRGMGMLHFGDEPASAYTNQDRGNGRPVWLNNEYDLAYMFAAQFLRTGETIFFDNFEAMVRHWMDVDFIHADDDPLRLGGVATHSAGHAEQHSVSPSHERLEGFFAFYHLTGCHDAREKGRSVAYNLLRWTEAGRFEKMIGHEESSRELGWALYNLACAYDVLREEPLLRSATRVADLLLHWLSLPGGLSQQYTSHFSSRALFMVDIVLNALARYYEISGDERVPPMVCRELDFCLDSLLGWCGLPLYKEFPPARRLNAPSCFSSLAFAYHVTKDDKYLKIGLRLAEHLLERWASGFVVHTGAMRPQTFADGSALNPCIRPVDAHELGMVLPGLFRFLDAVEGSGLRLDFLDYEY